MTNPEFKNPFDLNLKLKNATKPKLCNVRRNKFEEKKIRPTRKRKTAEAEPNNPKITNFFKPRQVGVKVGFDNSIVSGGGEAVTKHRKGVGTQTSGGEGGGKYRLNYKKGWGRKEAGKMKLNFKA